MAWRRAAAIVLGLSLAACAKGKPATTYPVTGAGRVEPPIVEIVMPNGSVFTASLPVTIAWGDAQPPPPPPAEQCFRGIPCQTCIDQGLRYTSPFGCQAKPYCLKSEHWVDDFTGCVKGGPTPTPSPSPPPGATPARLVGGALQKGGEWFPAGEQQMRVVGADVIYAADAQSAVAFCRKWGRGVAAREVWNGFAPILWTQTPAQQMATAQAYWRDRLEPYLRERLTTQPQCPKPDMVTMESMVVNWAEGRWGAGGFCATVDAKTGKCAQKRPVEKWPGTIAPAYVWLMKQWKQAGGGRIVTAPFLFSNIVEMKDRPHPQGGTLLQRYRRNEPALFPAAYVWKPLDPKGAPAVDYPTREAWEVSDAAFDRWVERYRYDLIANAINPADMDIVAQISNGAYRHVAGDVSSVWQNRFTLRVPQILKAHGFQPYEQIELFSFSGAKPQLDCLLLKKMQSRGGTVSAFDLSLAIPTHKAALACK